MGGACAQLASRGVMLNEREPVVERDREGERACGREGEICWICLEEEACSRQPLLAPCSCPRKVHAACLARWQLQSAGRREEKQCRFCEDLLPDWRHILTANDGPSEAPVMTVIHRGQMYVLPVQPGPRGLVQFQDGIREIYGYNKEIEINLSFGCTVPGSGEMVTLEGCGAFDAAVHCAAVSAGLLQGRSKRKRDAAQAAQQRLIHRMAQMDQEVAERAVAAAMRTSASGATSQTAAAGSGGFRRSTRQRTARQTN